MVVTGKAYWAALEKPKVNAEYNINRYELTLAVDNKNAAELEAVGIEVKTATEDDNKGFVGKYVVCKKQAVNKKTGEKNASVPVVDKNKTPMTKSVGNGSVVNVSITPFEWTFAGKKGVMASLRAVQVIELEEYTESGVSEFDSYDSEVGAF